MPGVKAVLKNVQKLELNTNQLVEGLISGNYRSIFKGRGIEFSEVREYVPGDDIRCIDWNVTARLNTPFVKEFIEERDLNVYIIFDKSKSNDFGTEKSKKEIGFEISASIMLSAIKNNDNIGLCLFTDRIEQFYRPRKGKKHCMRLLRELIYYEPKNSTTDINVALSYLNKIIKKRSILFIISDFFSEDFQKPICFLKNRHDVILINLMDIRETEIPDVGYVFLEDEETGEQIVVNTSDTEFRHNYQIKIAERNNILKQKMKRMNVDVINIKTDEPFHIPLKRFFKLRQKRIR